MLLNIKEPTIHTHKKWKPNVYIWDKIRRRKVIVERPFVARARCEFDKLKGERDYDKFESRFSTIFY